MDHSQSALHLALLTAATFLTTADANAHGTVDAPKSRVYRVYQSNPENPNFPLAANAVRIDGTQSYYTWNELSRNIPQAVRAGLPPGFDYSPWIPDGQLASAGRVDRNSPLYPRTYLGLDQVSADWPTTPVTAGSNIRVDFLATAPHSPSVWDVWMTTPDWRPTMPLRWPQMQFLGRPTPTFANGHYTFPLQIPANRVGHHVLWVVWQRNDPAGEAFFSTSDLLIRPAADECSGALPLQDGVNGPFGLDHASTSTPTATCETGTTADLWFRYQATCTGNLRVDTCASAGLVDTVLSLWSGQCASLQPLTCNDNACGPRSVVSSAVRQGEFYFIKLSGRQIPPNTPLVLTLAYDNGSGRFTETSPGCGPLLVATGFPNLGGYVDYEITGVRGSVQGLFFGSQTQNTPLCPGCHLGTDIQLSSSGMRLRWWVPCDPSLIGATWLTQGIDALGAQGCDWGNGFTFALTPTVRTNLGQ